LGTIIGEVGSVEKAVATLEKAIQIGEGLVTRQPENLEYQYRRAKARSGLGYLYWRLQQYQKARPYLDRAARELEAVVRQEPAKQEYRLTLAGVYNSLGNVIDDRAEAKRHFELARNLAQQAFNQHPDDPKTLEYLMPPIGNLAMKARQVGEY